MTTDKTNIEEPSEEVEKPTTVEQYEPATFNPPELKEQLKDAFDKLKEFVDDRFFEDLVECSDIVDVYNEANDLPSSLEGEEISSDDEYELFLRRCDEELSVHVSLNIFTLWCEELEKTRLIDGERIVTPYRIIRYVKSTRYDSYFIREW